ncbi:hypothetical protein [Clostridium akagii]|uniref:hypothetical protein n=1 Tax=Clostridium akagii TaxID=91623 RepID=UPI00068B9B4A|nr:hypothetical protein [Clostridium akagii]
MREVGIVKWFGGYNPSTHKLNDYGYIIRKNKPDLYFNRSHLRCKVKVLKPEAAVSFEIGINFKNNMEQAFKVKLLRNENLEFIIQSDTFHYLKSEEKLKFLNDFNEEDIEKIWVNLELKLKILLLFRISSENLNTEVLEKFIEKDKFIRAIILIVWIKNHRDKKTIVYDKASVLLSFYLKKILDGEEEAEKLRFIFPQNKNYKVDINKAWSEWTVFDLVQDCNDTNIAEDMDAGNHELIKIVTCLYAIDKQIQEAWQKELSAKEDFSLGQKMNKNKT